MIVSIDVSVGELVDKLSILNIKLIKISDNAKLVNITNEHTRLYNVYNQLLSQMPVDKHSRFDEFGLELYEVNLKLWNVEDEIRECERTNTFDDSFLTLARSVYKLNDHRSSIKRMINNLCESDIIEEKSYSPY